MTKLSACIEMIFNEVRFIDRIAKVSEIGMPAFEFWNWSSKNINEIDRERQKYGLRTAAFGVDIRKSIVEQDATSSFLEAVERSIGVARQLGCQTLITTTGNELKDVPRIQQHANIVRSLEGATTIAEKEGVTLVLEPLNVLVDHKGYYLSSSSEGFEIIREIGSPNVKLLYDIYHQQIMEGNLISTIRKNIDLIGHFHVADVPGRHEPGTGEINYANVLRAISDTGYNGYVGLEFMPTKDPKQALKYIIDIRDSIQ